MNSITKDFFFLQLQFQAYRQAKSFFDQTTISIFEGVSLVKSKRSSKSLEEPTIEIESANTVEARTNALESYVINRAKNFFQERSLSWDFVNTARTLANAIPEDIKESVRSLVVEERGIKKIKKAKLKAIKNFVRLLALIKIKIFAAIALVAILIAKKALLLSVIAIIAAGASVAQGIFSKLRGLGGGGGLGGIGGGNSGGHGGGHEEIIAYTNGGSGSGGWTSSGGSSGGWSGRLDSGYGEHGSHSSPVAQSIAYSGHQNVARQFEPTK